MNRLQSQLHRLYPLPGDGAEPGDSSTVRTMVLELADPPDWGALSSAWRGVQADFQLPAPGIGVSGTDGLQLWFSLAAPVEATRAAAFLEQLRSRYLPDIAPSRLRLSPSPTEPGARPLRVPALQPDTGNWSAFVSPDLAPVFGDSPWLDIPPGADGQADLLSRLEAITPTAFEQAMRSLDETPAAPPRPSSNAAATGSKHVDPRSFLQQVLDDEGVPLALRIEAAKALLGR